MAVVGTVTTFCIVNVPFYGQKIKPPYVAAYVLTYLIFNTESYWRETKGFNATVFPTGKTLPDSAFWPGAVVLVAFLIGGLQNAGNTLQGADFPSGLVGVIQGIILFSTLGGELLVRNRIRFGGAPAPEPAA